MDSVLDITRADGIVVLAIDNPPVNALGHAVRHALHDALDAADADAGVRGVVIACRGRTFFAGADIREFDRAPVAPTLTELIARIETMQKPVAAAMHGTVLGGGLELALACHIRVLAADAVVGLPEIKLGLIPGGGGTVRLPRLIGAAPALVMIASGEPVPASDAQQQGIVHALAFEAIEGETIDYLRSHLRSLPTRARDLPPPVLDAAFEARVVALTRKAGNPAVARACEAVRNAATLAFDAALLTERAIFEDLRAGPSSRAQRHLFFAERQTASVGDLDLRKIARRPVRRVGIVGAGTLGSGIALAFVNAGFDVTVREVSETALAAGLSRIGAVYDSALRKGTLSRIEAEARLARVAGTTTLADLASCDLVVEAAFEDLAIKQAIFAELDRILRPGAILATNTSYLDIDVLAAATSRPQDVAGMHFFSPAHVMKLVEVVRGAETAPDVLATLYSLGRAMAKVPVVVGVCHGFVGNRMLGARNAQIPRLLLEGALPHDIDEAHRRFGWPMGPLQMWDMAGLDIAWRNRKFLGQHEAIADSLCEQGRFGQKTGSGYYRYEPGSREPLADGEVTRLIEQQSRAAGVTRRSISHDEILERTHLPMVNEGWRILDENVVSRAADIDVVWANGYGFPRWLGGPMHWAEQQGWGQAIAGLNRWQQTLGDARFAPAAGLIAAATGSAK
ncbi:MAG: 3-hydroxyacyl-CoA dehydrogenase [Hyphomicrobiales bacterium]|nr:MAG: 3-hydroxyacyl-CoA dehydrogenase [Hyphomicrobiales bacterium]